MPYATCTVCEEPIDDPGAAVVAREVRPPDPYENDGGEVSYRHEGCEA